MPWKRSCQESMTESLYPPSPADAIRYKYLPFLWNLRNEEKGGKGEKKSPAEIKSSTMPASKNTIFRFPSNPVTCLFIIRPTPTLVINSMMYFDNLNLITRWLYYCCADSGSWIFWFQRKMNIKYSDQPIVSIWGLLQRDVFPFTIKQDLCRIIYFSVCVLYFRIIYFYDCYRFQGYCLCKLSHQDL